MKRQARDGEFRANVHQGGNVVAAKISRAERAIALKAAKVIGLGVAGVDILRSDSGPKILEINSSPGIQGIERATGADIATNIIEYIEKNVGPKIRSKRGRKPSSRKIEEAFAEPGVTT